MQVSEPAEHTILRYAGCECRYCMKAVKELEEQRYKQLAAEMPPRDPTALPHGFHGFRNTHYRPLTDSAAADFMHTDYLARYLQSRTPLYASLSPCTAAVCPQPCRVELAGWLQELLGKDAASVVGDYLRGTGWPGASPCWTLRAVHTRDAARVFCRRALRVVCADLADGIQAGSTKRSRERGSLWRTGSRGSARGGAGARGRCQGIHADVRAHEFGIL